MQQIAALYVETDGAYFGLSGVDPWDEKRDARKYTGPHPVVAHPPCQRWGRFWHGSTRKPHQFRLGDDGGCFKAALAAVDAFGGVLEHPCDSRAWDAFGIAKPPRDGGWIEAGMGGWTCCVYQGQYGHLAGKPTWLYANRVSREDLPELRWGKTEQRIHPRALELHGYEKARRIGMMAMVGGKDKTRIRNATPDEFRDVLIQIARRCALQPKPSPRGLFYAKTGASMYLTANPHADAEGYFSDMQEHTDRLHSIEAEAGSALRSALAWGSGEWLGLRSIRDRMAGEVIAELAATEEGCEAITNALSTLAKFKSPEAVGAIWSLSDAWVKLISKEIETSAGGAQ